MWDPSLEWRWVEFLGLWTSGIVALLFLSTSLVGHWRRHRHR